MESSVRPAAPVYQRVSLFISHKVAVHRAAADRIKELLESRTERLDVYICEEMLPGDRWPQWIKDKLYDSQILLVLVPAALEVDLDHLHDEVRRFKQHCPKGRLVAVVPPERKMPEFLKGIEVLRATKDSLLKLFLKPLYEKPEFLGIQTPLNPRIPAADLERDAEEIELALRGLVNLQSRSIGESLIVETIGLEIRTRQDLSEAVVWSPNGCVEILNWYPPPPFSWCELRAEAEKERGKGTFWITEMENVILQVASGHGPEIMTSTFRGRGPDVQGQIFRPQLESFELCNGVPVRFHFFFHKVLVPELVRAPDRLGDVWNLLHVATRVRWEVVDPFIRMFLVGQGDDRSLIDPALRSLRIIEQEAERHDMFKAAVDAFEGADRDLVLGLLDERAQIHQAIEDAGKQRDSCEFLTELLLALDLNCRAMELLADRFRTLVQEDSGKTRSEMDYLRAKNYAAVEPSYTAAEVE